MTDLLFVVDDDTSLTAGDTTLKTLIEGLGYTTTLASYSDTEITSGYDGYVLGPSNSVAIGDGKYGGQNGPVFSAAILYWMLGVGMTGGNITLILDGNGCTYKNDSVTGHLDWTGESTGLVTCFTASGSAYYVGIGVATGGQVDTLGNRSAPHARVQCVTVDAGGELSNGDTDRERIVWLGWKDRFDKNQLQSSAEQFVEDCCVWLFGAASSGTSEVITPAGGLLAGGSSSPTAGLNLGVAGGVSAGGQASPIVGLSISTDGGAVAGGAFDTSAGSNVEPDGGPRLGGSAVLSSGLSIPASGGALLDGAQPLISATSIDPAGGALLGGTALVTSGGENGTILPTDGGPLLGGSSPMLIGRHQVGSGGSIAGGASPTLVGLQIVPAGRAVIGGTAVVTSGSVAGETIDPAGGARVGGTTPVTVGLLTVPDGGAVAGGTAGLQVALKVGTAGGAVLGGAVSLISGNSADVAPGPFVLDAPLRRRVTVESFKRQTWVIWFAIGGRREFSEDDQRMLTVEHTTSERLWAAIRSPQDPTATLPEWSITSEARTDPGGWHEGRWAGSWDSRNGRIEVESALLGASQVLQVEAGTNYDVWLRFWIPGQVDPIVEPVAKIRAR